MDSLTTTLQVLMTDRLLGRLASDTGLPEPKVKAGVTGAIAAIFEELAGKADDPQAMGRVAGLLSRGPDVDVDRPERLFDEESPARRTTNDLLGVATSDRSGLISRLASMLGISGKSAGSLVAVAASLLFAGFRTVGKPCGGLDANGVASILHDERRAIHVAMPRELAPGAGAGIGRESAYVGERATIHREHARTCWWVVLLAFALIASSRRRSPTFSVMPAKIRVLGWSSIT